jgi:type IV secretory pathway TrbL component
MDLRALFGVLIVIALCWWALRTFGSKLPDILVTILTIVLVVVSVVWVCQAVGIPLPIHW